MTRALVCLLVLLAAAPVSAEEGNPLRWPSHRPIADWLSTSAVAGQIALRAHDAWQQPDRRKALGCMALENAIGLGANELLKRLTHRMRPDGSDDKSFPSMHTALGAVNATRGWQWGLTVQIGYGRMAADKHHATDVMAGAGLGWAASKVCR